MWASFWASLVGLLNKAFPFIAAVVAYWKGQQSKVAEQELKTLQKEKEYLEIELQERNDSQRMKDGTW